MTRFRLVLIALALLVIVLGIGWVWGASGRSTLQSDLDATTLRLDLARARAALLEARVDLFEVNFGNASRALESARAPLAALAGGLRQAGSDVLAARVGEALAAVEQAQDLTGRLDQSANARAADAVRRLDEIASALPPPTRR